MRTWFPVGLNHQDSISCVSLRFTYLFKWKCLKKKASCLFFSKFFFIDFLSWKGALFYLTLFFIIHCSAAHILTMISQVQKAMPVYVANIRLRRFIWFFMQILTKDTSQKISTGYIQHCCHVVKRIMVNETNKGYTRQILFNIYYNVVNYPETAPFYHFYSCLSEQSPVFHNMYQYTS